MRIMMDIDGIVADFVLDFTRLIRLNFPDKLDHSFGVMAATEWGFKNILTNKEIGLIWDQIYASSSFWSLLQPMFTPADRDAFIRMADKHELQWVTSRSGKNALDQTKYWLRRHGLPNWENAVLAGESKGEFVKEHGLFDVAFDDSPTQIKRLQDVGQFVVVRNTPYNQEAGFPRVNSVAEFEFFLEQPINQLVITNWNPSVND